MKPAHLWVKPVRKNLADLREAARDLLDRIGEAGPAGDRLRTLLDKGEPQRPSYQVTDADRAEARRRHEEELRAHPFATVIYLGSDGSGTEEDYVAALARIIARKRVKAEKLRARRKRARERKRVANPEEKSG